MSRFHEPSIYDRSHGPAPGAGADGLEGAYSATLVAAPSNGTVKVLIPALDNEHFYLATCSPAFGGAPGDSVLVVLDEAKHGWVVSPRFLTLTKAEVTSTGITASDVGALAATAAAGGDLSGSYPNPILAQQPAARATLTTNFSVPNAAYTAIPWSTTEFNQGTLWSSGAATRLTFAQAGLYLIETNVEWVGSTAGTRRDIVITKNGVANFPALGADNELTPSIVPHYLQVTVLARFVVTDYIEVAAYQDTGAALVIRTGDGIVNHLSAVWLGH